MMLPGTPEQTPHGGSIFGVPGRGKTTFLKAFINIAKKQIKVLFLRMKECVDEVVEIQINDLEAKISTKISSILHFTAPNTLRPSFDLLIVSDCYDIDCLIAFAEKKFRQEISMWITSRLVILKKFFIRGDKLIIPLCLKKYDELVKRLGIGIIYTLREEIPYYLLLDDTLSLILNTMYGDTWMIMSRPYMASFNYFPDVKDVLRFDPVVITPGSDYGGLYRLTSDKYVVMYNRQRWELRPEEVYALANS
jgi:hypothetical protein